MSRIFMLINKDKFNNEGRKNPMNSKREKTCFTPIF